MFVFELATLLDNMASFSYKRDGANSWNVFKVFQLCEDNGKLISFLQDLGLLAKEYKCPTCGKGMQIAQRSDINDGVTWQCRSRLSPIHNARRSIRKGTWFEQSNLTIREIIILTYFWVEEYRQDAAAREGNFAKGAVVGWYNFCRQICFEIMGKSCRKIGGVGHIVEVDESHFGKGKNEQNKWVFGGIDRETRECFLQLVEDRSRETLVRIIKEHVVPGTTIYSDSKIYMSLEEEGFPHMTVNHSKNFKDPVTGCHTNNIKGLWHHVKEKCPSTNRQKSMMDSYLSAYLYRQWRGMGDLHDNHRFITFLRDVATIYHPHLFDV